MMHMGDKVKERRVKILSFATVFMFLVLHNLMIPAMRSLPDEMGAVALAANIAGYDWSYVLTHPTLYYGFGGTLLFLPFFLLIKNPVILYQCLLGCGAFMRAIPAFLAAKILYSQNGLFINIKHKHLVVYFCSLLCALLTGTRSSNIDNEALLILCGWVIFYLTANLIFNSGDKKKLANSSLLAFFLCFSLTVHTRAILYVLCIALTIAFSSWIQKRLIIHLRALILTFIPFWAASQWAIKAVQNEIYSARESREVLKNSTEGLGESIQSGLALLFEPYGVNGFFDLLSGNFWVLFVASTGILLIAFCFIGICCFQVVVRRVQTKVVTTQSRWACAGVFPFLGIILSVGGVCVNWLSSAIAVYEGVAKVSRGHFYLRYVGNYFGPLLLVFFVLLLISNAKEKKHELLVSFIISLGILEVCSLYGISSFIATAAANFPNQCADWFYSFAPFAGIGVSWPDLKTSELYFATATLIALIIFFLMAIAFVRRKVVFSLALALLSTGYQYTYATVFFDQPYAASANYYGAVNAIYNLRREKPEVFEGLDILYFYSATYGSQYNVQFFLPDIKVVVVSEPFEIDGDLSDIAVLSQIEDVPWLNKPEETISFNLDENEILFITDANRASQISN